MAAPVPFLYYFVSGSLGGPAIRVTSTAPTSARSEEAPPFHTDLASAKPFPATLDPSRFSIPAVVRAYAIAREIPEVLAQQPCYCYCERFGHQSLLDCYSSNHGASCTVCLKEAFLAEQMTKSGKTSREIRDAIMKGFWRIVEIG